MTVRRGVVTSQHLISRGRMFLVEDSPYPCCFRDRWGVWHCGHDHSEDEQPPMPLQDVYQYLEGWTAQHEPWEEGEPLDDQ